MQEYHNYLCSVDLFGKICKITLILKSRQSLKGIKNLGLPAFLTESEVYVLLFTYTALQLRQRILATPEFFAL
jgi:hypothetical protein